MHRRRGDGGKESVFMCEWRRFLEFDDADEGRVSRTGSGGVTSAGQVSLCSACFISWKKFSHTESKGWIHCCLVWTGSGIVRVYISKD